MKVWIIIVCKITNYLSKPAQLLLPRISSWNYPLRILNDFFSRSLRRRGLAYLQPASWIAATSIPCRRNQSKFLALRSCLNLTKPSLEISQVSSLGFCNKLMEPSRISFLLPSYEILLSVYHLCSMRHAAHLNLHSNLRITKSMTFSSPSLAHLLAS